MITPRRRAGIVSGCATRVPGAQQRNTELDESVADGDVEAARERDATADGCG